MAAIKSSAIFICRFCPADTNAPVTNYRRELNLNDAVTDLDYHARRSEV